jgi:drug/metabolite transporter (DMT)-like permease
MTPKPNDFFEEDDDHSDYDDSPPVHPVIFFPPTVSTISINDLPFEQDPSKPTSWLTHFSGIIYALIASFIFTCASFWVKQLGIDLLDALIFRFLIQALMTFSFARHNRYALLSGSATEILLQILCCAGGAGGVFIYFIAVRYVALSDVTTLCYTRVIWTVILSIFIDRERPSIAALIALPLTVLGVIFVAQPSFLFSSTNLSIVNVNSEHRILGLSLSITSSFTAVANVLSYKQLISTSKHIKPSVITFQCCSSVLIFLIINQLYKTFFLHTGLTFHYVISWRYLLASIICLAMIACTILSQKAMKREHPAVFTLLGSADIIFSLILQNIFTTKRSNLFAILGSALVICSVLIIGLSKMITERHAQKKIKSMVNQTTIKDFEETDEKC